MKASSLRQNLFFISVLFLSNNQVYAFLPSPQTSTAHHRTHGTVPKPQIQSNPTSPNANSRISPKPHGMVGDFFSGITGQAPASLDPPLSLLENTNIDPSRPNVDLKCVYKASKDGFSAVDFHEKCDGRGSGLVIILTGSGKKFGGFNPLGWESTDDYGNTNAAFLFFDKGGKSVTCPVLSGGNAAIFDYATGGPQFGSVSSILDRKSVV